MGPLPSKRRKLHHNSHGLDAANGDSQTNEDETSSLQEDGSLQNDAPTPIPMPRPLKSHLKSAHHTDESALYAGVTYKSSMFKLQVDEMLAEVRPKKRMSGIDEALHRLNTLIGSIEERAALSITDATKLLSKSHKITIPFPDPKPDKEAAYKLAFAKPSRINVVGSYALNTMTRSESVSSVDMVVIMPESIFQEKDFLNYRYFYKRSYYLACIAAGIQENAGDEFTLDFGYLNGNSLQPILIAKPKSKSVNSKFEIRVIPGGSSSLFAESKLRPSKSSIRPKHEPESSSRVLDPSPFYNATLRSDCNFESYLKLLHSASKQSNSFRDSCILGRIWLRQRGFGSSVSLGGFGHFEWATLSALLLMGGGPKGHSILSPGYSSYQMFRAVVQFLATSDLAAHPQIYKLSDFVSSKSDDPMFYDGPRGQNILYKMTPWSYALLREEAKASIDMLDDVTFDQFEPTFIARTDAPLQRFDCLVRFDVSEHTQEVYSCDHRPYPTDVRSRLFRVLREGFNDRLKLLDIRSTELSSWPLKSTHPTATGENPLVVAVTFDPANIDRLVDHGPSAEEKVKAAKFRKFWGEKAELRRFKDGSILEKFSLVTWLSIFDFPGHFYLLDEPTLHRGDKWKFAFTGEEFEKLLPSVGSRGKAFEELKLAFSGLERDIQDLKNLPLQLRLLSPISPQLRYSTVDVPSFDPRHPLQKPADILIQFEGSGRWPDDIIAIQRTKIALLLKIGSLLQETDSSIVTRLGLEREDRRFQNCAFLDIIYQSGAVFRLRIHNDREETLLSRYVKEKATDHLTREDAVLALSTYKQTFWQLPLHNQSITTNCTRFPLLSSTIRLTKKWFDSHMLSRHMSEEFIELLVARTFLQPFPWRAPSSAMTGFLRTLLFISRWDWRKDPLIVDFNGTMTSKEVASINTRQEAWRKIDPAMNRTVIFAASSHDMTDTTFTSQGPPKMVAARMTALARSACKVVKDQGLNLNPKSLFASSTSDYDFVIRLSLKFVTQSRKKEPTTQKFKNLEIQREIKLDVVDCQPIQTYLDDLEKLYGEAIIFFYNASSGVIAGLWNPQAVQPRSFKVNLTYATSPANFGEEESQIQLDKAAILSEITRLGDDLVSTIEINR